MKNLLFSIVFVFVFGNVFSQTTLFENNFDSYSNGDKVAQVAGTPWTTWSNAPGGSEDGTVSNTQSVSPNNSINIITNNDLVIDLEDKTTGRYRVDFDFMVEAGKFGYFNLLQDFAGSNSKWGLQVKFMSDLSGAVDGGGADAATFTYSADNWMHMRIFVDLDNDLGTFLIDGNEIHTWKWSDGANGGNDLLKLDAVNLFGWSGTKGTAGYYVDNFVFSSLPTLNSPENIVAVLDGAGTGIDVSWDEPANIPDSYGLLRNSKSIASGLSSTSFNDPSLYPNTYTYNVIAFYSELGYSPASVNSTPVTISGGTARELVVFEIGTGTNCGYCPGASMGAHDLENNGKNVAIIKYQTYSTSDPYYNGVGLNRVGVGFYNFTGYPTTMTDGTIKHVGGSATESLYPAYLNYYDERISKPALYTMSMTITNNGSDNYTASITVNEISDYLSNPVRLVTALTDSHHQYNWGNQTEVNNRCIGLYPDETGSPLTFSAGTTTLDIPFSLTVDGDLTINDYEFIAFIQEDNTKEIIQAVKLNMSDAVTSIADLSNEISIYPNPARKFVTINATANSTINIYDITGKIIMNETLRASNQQINIEKLNKGIYFVNINSENKTFNTKLVIE